VAVVAVLKLTLAVREDLVGELTVVIQTVAPAIMQLLTQAEVPVVVVVVMVVEQVVVQGLLLLN
jgi:hypothetical protein